ncbi:hypothetical protein [Shouchella miscanthi]|uniref:Thiopeptide-type bacteriocin biosynthesis domain-containing protein n=1 Tax=Shouchella miscanthi TaxID=2598861 RepID=A0ABU6NQQ8_9BACI|nr:hypothetical protein [Shouchella miscanthi]
MEHYSIKCYVVEPSQELKATIKKLIKNYNFMIDKGWENGYHLHLRGTISRSDLSWMLKELKEGVNGSLTSFDEAEFSRNYQSTATILRNAHPFNPIFKNEVIVKEEVLIFNEELEDELFKESNKIFDHYFSEHYFEENALHPIIAEIMKFHHKMKEYEQPETYVVEHQAYNCHLSHYVAFINRLNDQDKELVENDFQRRFESDSKEGLLHFDLSPTALTENLLGFFYKLRPLIERKDLNFYMPFDRSHIDEKIEYASKRHQVTFAKENMHLYLYNEVLIANRWVTNALYKKLLLLGLTNMDRFYMNYVIARLNFSEKELSDYPVQSLNKASVT